MSFRLKIVIFFLVAAIIPVSVAGILSIRTSQQEMLTKTSEYMEKIGKVMADAIDYQFEELVGALKLSASLIPFEQFPKEDLKDAVGIPYRQFKSINAVALIDSQGNLLTSPYYLASDGSVDLSTRYGMTKEDVVRFLRQVNVGEAIKEQHAFSEPYFCERTRSSRVALGLSFPVKEGKDKWVLAVELSLKSISSQLAEAAPRMGSAVLVDRKARVVSPPEKRSSYENRPMIGDGFLTKKPIATIYDVDGVDTMGVFAPIPYLGYGLVIEQPASVALKSVFRIRNHTILWTALGIITAIIGGFLLGREIGRPIMELTEKAKQMAAGLFDNKIAIRSKDEIGQLANSFNNMSSQLEKRIEQLENLFNSSTRTLVAAVEAKDRYTAGHSERVTAYALVLSDTIGISERDRSIVEISGLLHDVGKIGVPESILNKPGILEKREYDIIKYHPVQGYEIVRKIDHPFAEEVAMAVRTHHERWDGRGYPDGLKGDQLSLVARILTVADAFDAMTSSRAYRKGLPPEVAIERLEAESNSQFDGELVRHFARAYEKGLLEEIAKSAKTLPPLTYDDEEEQTEVVA